MTTTPADSDELAGRACIVTGAARGLGAELTRHLAARGMRVLACDLDAASGLALAERLCGENLDVRFERVDLRVDRFSGG